jgi:hypothetical protein
MSRNILLPLLLLPAALASAADSALSRAVARDYDTRLAPCSITCTAILNCRSWK